MAGSLATPAEAQDSDAAQAVWAALQASPGVKARFVETQQLALLTLPLTSEGWLHVHPPHTLVRIATSEPTQRLVLRGTELQITDASGTQQIDLAAHPQAAALVGALVDVFSGDLAALRESFEVETKADGGPWTVILTARSSGLVERLEIRGEGPAVQRVVVAEQGGDTRTLEFSQIDAAHAHSAEELEALGL